MLLKAFRKLSKSKLNFIHCILFVIYLVEIYTNKSCPNLMSYNWPKLCDLFLSIYCKFMQNQTSCVNLLFLNENSQSFGKELVWLGWPHSSHGVWSERARVRHNGY